MHINVGTAAAPLWVPIEKFVSRPDAKKEKKAINASRLKLKDADRATRTITAQSGSAYVYDEDLVAFFKEQLRLFYRVSIVRNHILVVANFLTSSLTLSYTGQRGCRELLV